MRLVLLLLVASACLPPAPRPTRGADGPPDVSTASLELGVHDATNAARQRDRLGALTFDDGLSDVARRHSADMARRGFFSHTAPDGADPTTRVVRAGLECRVADGRRTFAGVSENIAQVWTARGWTETRSAAGTRRTAAWRTPREIVAETVGGWLASPPHRRNLLLARATHEGVGVALDAEGRVYVTQMLC